MERRIGIEEELRGARAHLAEMARREMELRDEVVALDGILGVAPAQSPAPPAPAAASEAPTAAAVPQAPGHEEAEAQGDPPRGDAT